RREAALGATPEGLPSLSVDPGRLSPAAVEELHRVARASWEAAASLARYEAPYPKSPELLKQRAVFVTVLDETNHEIACMGTFKTRDRLCVAVAEAARSCGLGEDPQRVSRLTPREAREGAILISVIRNPRMVGSWTEVKNGQGVMVARGTARGVVLPTAAARHHWNVEDMLTFACRRAGFKPDAWRDDKVDILVFDTDEY
ncbi:MAG: AMMECR1 domain-containing protein, partial [Planctomycetes bacterium]|nr:AMMECR1 domain-containing protein [Planctomycetota bacterium]